MLVVSFLGFWVQDCNCCTIICTCAEDELALTTALIYEAELAAGCLPQTVTMRLMSKMGQLMPVLGTQPDAVLFMLFHRSYRCAC